jgi:LPXTG-site transpeptidase (sortase) family protein
MNPDAQAKAQEVLETSVGETKPSVDPSMLLPVLPDEKNVRKLYSWPDVQIVPTDNRIVIPKLGKSVPLVTMSTEHIVGENWNELEKQIQAGLQQGIVHYPGTAKPGEFGNVFLTGHSSYYPWDPGKFKDVFATLGQLETGDRYYVYYEQKKFVYEVVDKREVQPSNVDVLQQPLNQKISTLMTCTPVGTTLRRLIITSHQVS